MKRKLQYWIVSVAAFGMFTFAFAEPTFAQRGGRGGGERSAGNRGGEGARGGGGGPSMSRPAPRPNGPGGSLGGAPGGLGGAGRGPGAGPGAGGIANRPNPAGAANRGPGGLGGPGGADRNPGAVSRPGGLGGNPGAGFQRPGGATAGAPGAGFQRPGGGSSPGGLGAGSAGPGGLANRPAGNAPGGLAGRPNPGGLGSGSAVAGNDRPGADRPRPGAGPSSSQLNDFLGGGDRRPGAGGVANNARPGEGNALPNRNTLGNRGSDNNVGNRTDIGNRNDIGNRTEVGNRTNNVVAGNNVTAGNREVNNRVDASRDVNVGSVNVNKVNNVNYNDNRQAWVDNRHVTGDAVRLNSGTRYYDAYSTGAYSRGVVGGYPYTANWPPATVNNAWVAPTFAAVGGFLGASLATSQPTYYGYGTGGNVYYEQNTVYVNGQSAGSPVEYAQQAAQQVAAAPAPAQAATEEWMPLGVFAITDENSSDSTTMLELAVSKSGVLAGTYYNESSQVSRPLKGTVDLKSQRAVVGFADGKNPEVNLETGLYNLTQDEAPSLLHRGAEDSSPVLLVRLNNPNAPGSN